MEKLKESQLIINPDGTIYHLNLKPEDIARTIIVVGDPQRVQKISKHFDKIEFKNQNREIITHTGYLNKKRLTVISSGMGPDNIDIVLNELDALVNIDLKKRIKKPVHTSLNIIRLGTSGAIQPDIPIDSFGLSTYGLGLDGLLNFYRIKKDILENDMMNAFIKHTHWSDKLPKPYVVKCSENLAEKIGKGMIKGITVTAPGFYGPQGRILRLDLQYPDLNKKIESFSFNNERIINFEMETSALYGLGKLLGHNIITVCAIIANRVNEKYSKNYKKPVKKLTELLLERLT